MSARTLQDRLDELVGTLPGSPAGVHGAAVRVEVPRVGFAHAAAAGVARADTGEPMTADRRFHVASVGKIVTATLVLRAVEDGRVGPSGLDTTLGALAGLDPTLVHGVHPDGPSITLRQLLSHTSGLKDVQSDGPEGTAAELGGPAPSSVQAAYEASLRRLAAGEPEDRPACRHRWRPWDPDRPDDRWAGMLNALLSTGTAAAPVGAPGERFHYSDTAYVLLGVIAEHLWGRPYHELQRELVVDPLGLRDTYLAYADDPSPDARRHEADVWYGGLPLLSLGADVSFDWGGGGQVSTVADLCRLVRGVVGGEVHRHAVTTAAVRSFAVPAALPPPFTGVGLGWLRWTAGSREVEGHAGAWGVRAFHDPATGAYVAGTVLQPDPCAWLAAAFDAVADELP